MKRPTALTVVAWMFVVSGALAIITVAIDLIVRRTLMFDISILNWWIGRSLLALRHRGYRLAMAVLTIELALLPLGAIFFLLADVQSDVRVFGIPIGHASGVMSACFAAAIFVLTAWQALVLRRAAARGVFTGDDARSDTLAQIH